jgi:TPR repeat protein
MSRRVKILALILTVTPVFLNTPTLFAQPAKSDPAVKTAQKYLDKGQIDKALVVLREAAGQGDAAAMGLLGTLYQLGLGIPTDNAQAADWFRKGAEGGDPTSMRALGVLYAAGAGVAKTKTRRSTGTGKPLTRGTPTP